jgi:hypothetical protein
MWTSVIDEPNSMRIWSTIDPSAMVSESSRLEEDSQACFYLNASEMSTILQSNLNWLHRDLQMAELGVGDQDLGDQEKTLDLKRSRAKRLEHLVTETPDMFAFLDLDGTLIIRALMNVDRRPPTLCQSFIVLKMATKGLVKSSEISSISTLAISTSASSDCYNPTGLLLLVLHSGHVIKLQITPSLLFDGLGDGIASLGAPSDVLQSWSNSERTEDAQSIEVMKKTNIAVEWSKVTASCKSSLGLLAIASHASEGDGHIVRIHDDHTTFYTQASDIIPVEERVLFASWSPSIVATPIMIALACKDTIRILSPRQMTYLDRLRPRKGVARWTTIAFVNLAHLKLGPITGVRWQSDLTLLVKASDLFLKYDGRLLSPQHGTNEKVPPQYLIELAARNSSPLQDHEPEVILHCLLWNKVNTALQILLNVADAVANLIPMEPLQVKPVQWSTTIEDKVKVQSNSTKGTSPQLFDDGQKEDATSTTDHIERLERLLERLQAEPLPFTSPSWQSQLVNILKTSMEVQRHEKLLDSEGLRYLSSLHFVHLQDDPGLCLDYKSFLWAFQSQSQQRLLQAVNEMYKGKMNWSLARKCGFFFWCQSHEDLCIQAEMVAKQQYSGQDERDPTSCSLLYYALKKDKLVWNLWRQAFWHPDQKKMLAFLKNDFSEDRWKTAAMKNAFALLSQRRFGEYWCCDSSLIAES